MSIGQGAGSIGAIKLETGEWKNNLKLNYI